MLRTSRLQAAALVVSLSLTSQSAAAQSSGNALEVVVVRDGVAGELDVPLRAGLRETAGFDRVRFASVSLEELRLAAGCSDESVSCLAALAAALDASTLVIVRRVGTGAAQTLTLLSLDVSSQDTPGRASVRGDSEALAHAVTDLLRSLYGIPAPELGAAPPHRAPGWGTWSLLGGGVASTLGGAILGASAAWGDHASLRAADEADVLRIESALGQAQTRALVGNVLIGVGVAALCAGVVTLLLDLLLPAAVPDTLQIALGPLGGGLGLQIGGAL